MNQFQNFEVKQFRSWKQQKGESDFIIRIHAKAGVLPLSVRLGTGCCTGPASQLTRLSPLQPTSKPLKYDSTIAKVGPLLFGTFAI